MLMDLPILIVALLGILFLGLFTYSKNPKSSTNTFFFLLTSTIALYIVVNYFSLHQATSAATLFFIRTTMFIAAFINLFFFLLADSFPQPSLRVDKRILTISIFTTILLGIVAYTDFIFRGVLLKHGNIEPVPGVGIPLFLLHTIAFLGGGFVALIRKFKKSAGIAKAQIKLFLLGAVAMFVSILTANLFLVLVFNTSALVGLLPVYILVFVSFVSYAIVRHRFLDIGLLVARSVTYTLLIAIIAALFSILVLIGGNVILNLNFTGGQLLLMLAVTILVALSFQFLRKVIERLTNRYLFKNRYSTHVVLGKLSSVMASTLRLDDLLHGMIDVLMREVNITEAAFVLLSEGLVADVKSEGFEHPPTFDEEEIKQMSRTRDTLVFDELEEGLMKEILRKLGLSVVVHLRTEGKQIGLMVLGSKKSGDIYSDQDLSLAGILAPEAAVAIQNAQSYEEIRRFNITLQEEVDKATSDLKAANEKLLQLDKLKDEFVSLASHELRSPMTAIKSYAWMVLNGKAGPLEPKAKDYLNIVYSATERLIRLVNDMLNISRIESGRIQMHKEMVDLVKAIGDIKEEFSARASERGLRLAVVCDTSLPPITADKGKVTEILENLVSNGIKFTPTGGSITITASRAGAAGAAAQVPAAVTIAVADTGKGISKEDLPKLFGKFSRIESSLSSISEAGTGLGLYLSKEYAKLHGGDISVKSTVGKGTTFTVTLPLSNESKG